MSIIVGIDGTGADFFPYGGRNQRYDDAFANSFVRKLCDKPPTPNKKYLRGPVVGGGGLLEASSEGLNFVLAKRRAGVNEPILLTGYSRGAAGVIFIATRLQSQNIDVKAMLLFDCVDRQGDIDATVIPNNVGYVLHLLRAPESGSRNWFGNAGRQSSPPTRYFEAIFYCTHGGMGGVPWSVPDGKSPNDYVMEDSHRTNITYAQDARGSERAWYYAKPFMDEHGFPIPPA
ncbi:MAG TPA: hypothetical protein VFV58_13990 [Blastocatellia bacterium]|nr:hypothetical protein [Blastocatellia bacterium]